MLVRVVHDNAKHRLIPESRVDFELAFRSQRRIVPKKINE